MKKFCGNYNKTAPFTLLSPTSFHINTYTWSYNVHTYTRTCILVIYKYFSFAVLGKDWHFFPFFLLCLFGSLPARTTLQQRYVFFSLLLSGHFRIAATDYKFQLQIIDHYRIWLPQTAALLGIRGQWHCFALHRRGWSGGIKVNFLVSSHIACYTWRLFWSIRYMAFSFV